MHRRSVLSLLAAGFCGCSLPVDQSDTPTSGAFASQVSTTTPTEASPRKTRSPVDSTDTDESQTVEFLEYDETYELRQLNSEISIHRIEVTESITYFENPELRDIAYRDGYCFVFIDLQVSNDSPPEDMFRVILDRNAITPTQRVGGTHLYDIVMAESFAAPYPESNGGGILAFEVPVDRDSYSEVYLALEHGEGTVLWELPARVLDNINSQSRIQLHEWMMPACVERGETFEVTFLVENTGEDTGIFRARLKPGHTEQIATIIEEELPVDSETEITIEDRYPDTDFITPKADGETIEYVLNWEDNEMRQDVQISGCNNREPTETT